VYIGGKEVAMRAQVCRSAEGVLVRLYERGNDLWRVGTIWGHFVEIHHYKEGTLLDICTDKGIMAYFFVESYECEDEVKDKVHIEDHREKKEVANAS
jgi:hypothetical protein